MTKHPAVPAGDPQLARIMNEEADHAATEGLKQAEDRWYSNYIDGFNNCVAWSEKVFEWAIFAQQYRNDCLSTGSTFDSLAQKLPQGRAQCRVRWSCCHEAHQLRHTGSNSHETKT